MNPFDGKVDTIIIGGMGGSGTRLVAELMGRLGLPLADDVNISLDDLRFTWLLKRPSRFCGDNGSRNSEAIVRAIAVHEAISRLCAVNSRHCDVDSSVWSELGQACFDHLVREKYHPRRWILQRLIGLARRRDAKDGAAWCFKEPHATVFLPELAEWYGERMAYIHVIRDGHDMALSGTTQQFAHWGRQYGLAAGAPVPEAMFEFWYRFNRRALMQMRDVVAGPTVVVDYDRLVEDPGSVASGLIRWIGGVTCGVREDLVEAVNGWRASSRGRGKHLRAEQGGMRRKVQEIYALMNRREVAGQ